MLLKEIKQVVAKIEGNLVESDMPLSEEQILNSFLMEMANINTAASGLAYTIWVGAVGGQHGPRIKVSNIRGKSPQSDSFVMTVGETPEVLTPEFVKISKSELTDVSKWVKINYKLLIKIYDMFENDIGNPNKEILKLKKLKK